MSNLNTFSLPHPALGIEGDFKYGSFSVLPIISMPDNELIIDENNSVQITNEYIKKLYDEGLVTTAYKIVCSATLFSMTEFNNKNFAIPIELIAKSVELEIFLIATKKISNYHDKSFNDDYFIENPAISFIIEPGQIVAFGGLINIPLEEKYLKAASLFKFSKTLADSPLDFDCNGSHIQVIYPYENEQLDLTQVLPRLASSTFLNLIIIPALSYAFQLILEADKSDNLDRYLEENDWAFILTHNFPDYKQYIEKPHVLAQNYLKILVSDNRFQLSPIIQSFNELNKLKK